MPLVDDRTIELADIAKQTGSNTAQADGLACVFDLNSPGAIYPSHEFSRSQKNKLAQNKVMYNSMNSKCYTFRAYEADTHSETERIAYLATIFLHCLGVQALIKVAGFDLTGQQVIVTKHHRKFQCG